MCGTGPISGAPTQLGAIQQQLQQLQQQVQQLASSLPNQYAPTGSGCGTPGSVGCGPDAHDPITNLIERIVALQAAPGTTQAQQQRLASLKVEAQQAVTSRVADGQLNPIELLRLEAELRLVQRPGDATVTGAVEDLKKIALDANMNGQINGAALTRVQLMLDSAGTGIDVSDLVARLRQLEAGGDGFAAMVIGVEGNLRLGRYTDPAAARGMLQELQQMVASGVLNGVDVQRISNQLAAMAKPYT